ncbi:D-alanine--poly(phosphoribitol) ligase subunit 1 [Defluviimonas denitrificans]|jgi:D-alanine--poly(phosphoribitol) ligase subunit 1|uniref:D-alanine--poly(Phosphoribitol) ligase subunit 1 n=1 Tax=Albidovulum denitrificans TaxID=404881 RepID=A0A2S8S5F5_9RHOB|nr:D-alanine--poly(phosphoribitol) ligase subunit 1 [Defluviimonas denitrificans]
MTCAVTAHLSLRAVFDRFAGHTGLAYWHEDGQLSYRDLHNAASRLAARLAGNGSGPVLIHGHKDRRFLIAYWACLLSGRTIVPVELDQRSERIRQIARVSGATLALFAAPGSLPGRVGDLPAWPVEIEAPAPGWVHVDGIASDAAPVLPEIRDTAAAYVLFSSGTTGQPKGIAISYGNLADFADWAGTLLAGMDPTGCISGNVRYCFDVSLFEMWFAWLSLRPIVAPDHRDIFNIRKHLDRYRDHKLTTWVSTPALALHWLKDRRFDAGTLPDLHTMLFCGEVLTKSLVETLWSRFPGLRIINTYGPTECTVAVTSIEIRPEHLADSRPLPIGPPRTGTRLRRASAASGLDELIIEGKSVGLGYLGDPERQASAFPAAATYRTGDWGDCDGMGNWFFAGRKDREIKLNGYRIDLNILEAALRGIDGVKDAVVDLHPNGKQLRAFLLGPTGRDALLAIGRRLGRDMAPHMVPKLWYGADGFEMNANSKLDRGRFVERMEGGTPAVYVERETSGTVAAE